MLTNELLNWDGRVNNEEQRVAAALFGSLLPSPAVSANPVV